MSNRPNPRPAARNRTVAKARKSSKRPPTLVWVLLGIVVLGLVAVIIAALNTPNQSAEGQVQPVTISGTDLPALPDSGDDPAVGQPAPVVEGHAFDGSAVTLGGASDQPTLAVFVAHWCPHCRREVPLLVGWRGDGTIPDDIRLIAVPTSTASAQVNYPPQDWLEGEDWPDDILVDSDDDEAAKAYGVNAFPFFVAIDADGNVVARGTGELDQQGIEDLVATLESPAQ